MLIDYMTLLVLTRTHTGALPYSCTGCHTAASFASYDTLKRHIRAVHGNNLALAVYHKSRDLQNPWTDPTL
jgi:hypothetical protein